MRGLMKPDLVLMSIFLFASFFPAVASEFLCLDDYWGYVYSYQYPWQNPMFNTQAWYAGRPAGALVMGFLQMLVTSPLQANLIRMILLGLLIVLAAAVREWLIRHRYDNWTASLACCAVFTLPAFASPVYCITDGYAVYGTLPAIGALMILVRLSEHDVPIQPSWAQIVSAILLLFVSWLIYPPASTVYWALLAVPMVRIPARSIGQAWRVVTIWAAVGIGALVLYVAFFLLTQHSHSSTSVHVAPLVSAKFFFAQLLPVAARGWNLVTLTMLHETTFWSGVTAVPVVAIILAGSAVALTREAASVGRSWVLVKACILAVLFPLSVLPLILAAGWPSLSMRYLVGLQLLTGLTLIWAVAQLIPTRIASRALRLGAIGILALGHGIFMHGFIARTVTGPAAAELAFVETTLSHGFTGKERIHFIYSERLFPWVGAIGLQSTYGASGGEWGPALVITALRNLAAKDSRFQPIAREWSVGHAFNMITASSRDALERDNIYVDPRRMLVIDMTAIEVMIDPFVERDANRLLGADSLVLHESAWAQPPEPLPDKRTKTLPTTSFTDDLCRGAPSVSGGDYPGFSAAMAFDDNDTTAWASAQTGPDVLGQAFIGCEPAGGIAAEIRRIVLRQSGALRRFRVQSSDDGKNWSDVATFTTRPDKNTRYFDVPPSRPSRYWRLLADVFVSEGPAAWSLYGLEMMALKSEAH